MHLNGIRWDAGMFYSPDDGGAGAGEDASNDQGNETTDATTPEELKAELERTKAALKAANKEAGDRRKQLEAIENAKKDAEQAELAKKQEYQKLFEAEQQKAATLEKQLADAQVNMRRTAIRVAVEAEARKVNFAEPADAHLFLSLDSIEVDEDGKPKGVEAKVKELAKSKPYLVAQKTVTPGNGARPTPAGVGKQVDEVAAAKALAKVQSIF